MSALSIQVPFPVFNDRDGQPLDNGYVWIGVPNLPPQTNPVAVYFDEALTQPASQPLRTINGYISNAGTPAQVYIDGVNFSILVQDSKGTMVYNFPEGTGVSPDACGVKYSPPFPGAVQTTVCVKLAETVSVKDFGAVGDGVTDDTAAIQAAFDSASFVTASAGDVYRVTSQLFIPSNRYVDFNGATLKRDFANNYILNNFSANKSGTSFDQNITVKNIKFADMGKADASDFGAALRFSYCSNVTVDNVEVLFTSTQPSLIYGAWALYFSGKDITATKIKINNVAQGQQADGIHFGYLENFVMSDFNIVSGDDSLSLFTPPRSFSFTGENKRSKNVVIGNGYLSSPLFSAIKLGAHSNVGNPAPANCVYDNVLFHDIVIGPVNGAIVIIEDNREDADIVGKYNNIVFDNIHSVEQTTAFYQIGIFRAGGGNKEDKRFKSIAFNNFTTSASGTSDNLLRLNSVERLTFKNCEFLQNYSAAITQTPITTEYIDDLRFENCIIRTFSTASAALFRRTKNTTLVNTAFNDAGNGFRGIQIFFNTSYPISFWSIDGQISGYQRGIDIDNSAGATNLFADFVIKSTDIRATFTDITSGAAAAIAGASGLKITDLLERSVFSTGATGGSGSGGAGNQYVSLTIGSTTYKVLHDGTL
jgi:hypothetical protein